MKNQSSSMFQNLCSQNRNAFIAVFNGLSSPQKEALKKYLAKLPPKTYLENRQVYSKLNYLITRRGFFDSNHPADLSLFSNIMRVAYLQKKYAFLKTFLSKINQYLGGGGPVAENFIKQMPEKFSFKERWSPDFLGFMKWLFENVIHENIRNMIIKKAIRIARHPQAPLVLKLNALLLLVTVKCVRYNTIIAFRGKKCHPLSLATFFRDVDLIKAIFRSNKKINPNDINQSMEIYLKIYIRSDAGSSHNKLMPCMALLIDKMKTSNFRHFFPKNLLLEAISKAIRSKNNKMIDILQKLGSTIHPEQDKLSQALYAACSKQYIKFAGRVLEGGATSDEHIKAFIVGPIRVAIGCRRRDVGMQVLKTLLDRKVRVTNSSFNFTDFAYALRENNIEALKLLLRHPHSVAQLMNMEDKFKDQFLMSIIKSHPKIGVKNAFSLIKTLIECGIKDLRVNLSDYILIPNFLYLYHKRSFLHPLKDIGFNLIFISKEITLPRRTIVGSGLSGNPTIVSPREMEGLAGFIAQLKRSNKMSLSSREERLLSLKKGFFDQFPVFSSIESMLNFKSIDYSIKIKDSRAISLCSDIKVPKIQDCHERFRVFSEKMREYAKAFVQLLHYSQVSESEVKSLSAVDLKLMQKAIINKQFKHTLLRPPVRHLLLINKLGMWSVYQQNHESKGLVELKLRHYSGKRMHNDVEKRVNEFLTYEDVIGLKDYSIVFGRFRMKAISQRAAQPESGDGGRAQKRQRVGSHSWRDQNTLPRAQKGSSSSGCASSSRGMM